MSDRVVRLEEVGTIWAPHNFLFVRKEMKMDPVHLIPYDRDEWEALCGTSIFMDSMRDRLLIFSKNGVTTVPRICPRCTRVLRKKEIVWTPTIVDS